MNRIKKIDEIIYKVYDDYAIVYSCNKNIITASILDEIDDVPVIAICDWAFSGCKSLKNVVISNNITSIGTGAFAECDTLEFVDISDSVNQISNYAFDPHGSIKKIAAPRHLIEQLKNEYPNIEIIVKES